jgi:hypothetical protein
MIVANQKLFLKAEGYTDLEISKIVSYTEQRGLSLLRKPVHRMQHYTLVNDKYLVPKMFDRWLLFVKVRKLIRFILQKM